MNELREQIAAARFPAALTGAGISAPSGIPTFQGSYRGRPLRSYLTRDYMEEHPLEFFDLYCDMVKWCEKSPNAAHYALHELGVRVITQNIDGLHARAGSTDAIEMHGSLRFVLCHGCGWRQDSPKFAANYAAVRNSGEHAAREALLCPVCGRRIDTDVVLYTDAVRHLNEAVDIATRSDLFLVIGTSLETYPAAALPDMARRAGAKVVIINDDCVAALRE